MTGFPDGHASIVRTRFRRRAGRIANLVPQLDSPSDRRKDEQRILRPSLPQPEILDGRPQKDLLGGGSGSRSAVLRHNGRSANQEEPQKTGPNPSTKTRNPLPKPGSPEEEPFTRTIFSVPQPHIGVPSVGFPCTGKPNDSRIGMPATYCSDSGHG